MLGVNWEKVQTPEEKQFLKMLSDYEQKFERQNRSLYTDFYNVDWMRDVLKRYVGKASIVHLSFVGGYEDAERAVAGFASEYTDEQPVKALRINVKTGIGKSLSHRDYLGALLGLGIERAKLGDLIVDPEGAYLLVKPPLDDFIQWNLTGISRYGQVEVRPIALTEITITPSATKSIRGSVASLRADSVFALGFALSRSAATKLLQGEKGLRAGSIISANTLLKEGDICVLKGYGKFRLCRIGGQTRKDRLSIEIEKYV